MVKGKVIERASELKNRARLTIIEIINRRICDKINDVEASSSMLFDKSSKLTHSLIAEKGFSFKI